MSVKVIFIGRLGNNLFQYAVGRIIAERLGLALECFRRDEPTLPFLGSTFTKGPSAALEELAEYFPNAPLRISGKHINKPIENFDVSLDDKWSGQTLDLRSILMDVSPRQIRLAGYFQRFEYFAQVQESIRHWFALKAPEASYTILPTDVLVNIRRGLDYGIFGNVLSLAYYEKLLSRLSDTSNVYVCGVGIDDQVRRRFRKYNPTYYRGSPIEHFYFMTRFNRMILSNSTFAWWAAFLSKATEIYAPRSPRGASYGFTGFQDVDLHMRDSRYIEVGDTEITRLAPFIMDTRIANIIRSRKRDQILDSILSHNRGALDLQKRERCRDLLVWMAQQNKPITIGEMWTHYGDTDITSILDALVKARLVTIREYYLDD